MTYYLSDQPTGLVRLDIEPIRKEGCFIYRRIHHILFYGRMAWDK